MLFRVLIIGFFILEFFGCSSTETILASKDSLPERCYESSYMMHNPECLESEIVGLEEDLDDSDRVIYEMAKRKISDKYQQLYFLKLSTREKREYLTYLYNGEPPVYYKNGVF